MAIIRSSLSEANLKVNNRYQEMSGIMINESFNGFVNSPLRGDGRRTIENNQRRQHLIIKK